MPTLLNTLQGHDLTFINMVANAWGISLQAPDLQKARPIVIHGLKDANLVLEMVESLPAEARDALYHLAREKGVMPWAQFSRDYGDVRVMGAAKRDRERPDLNPVSPAEILWYRAFLGRAFLNLNNEPQEYAYIPEEIFAVLPSLDEGNIPLPGRPASPGESKHPQPTTDQILNDCTTVLAGLRIGMKLESIKKCQLEIDLEFILKLLRAGGVINGNHEPIPEATRNFFELSRGKALTFLVNTWMENNTINELLLTPDFCFETKPEISPILIRKSLMELLSQVLEDHWWNLESFVQFVYTQNPDFLRPAGDYDSWFIRNRETEEYYRGFQSWHNVEGLFLKFFITKILFWLGFVDLATSDNKKRVTAFRLSVWSKSLWNGKSPEVDSNNPSKIHLDRYGLIKIPQQSSLRLRYQISRFCEWEDKIEDMYHYRITPQSLHKAASQGLKISHLFTLLQNQLKDPFPPSLQNALTTWEHTHESANVSSVSLLRVPDPEILKKILEGRPNRFIQEVLSPTAAIIKPGQEEFIRKALFDLGIIVDYSLK